MATDSPNIWYNCTWLCVYIMERLNDSLVEFVNADSIQNGMIFDPLWVVPRDPEIRVARLIMGS